MYDAVNLGNLPTGGDLYAGYVGGRYVTWPTLQWSHSNSVLVSIAVDASQDAMVLDVERYDATPDQAPAWALRQRQRGQEPTVYCDATTWPAVKQAFQDQLVQPPQYWIANYNRRATIPPGAVAHQYTDGNGAYDTSVVADYWPGVDKQLQEDEMKGYAFTYQGVGYICDPWLSNVRGIPDSADYGVLLGSNQFFQVQFTDALAAEIVGDPIDAKV